MVARILDEISNNPPKEVKALLKLAGIVVQDDEYIKLVNEQLRKTPHFEKRKYFLEMRHFHTQDILFLMHACGDGSGINTATLMPLLRRLIDWGLVLDQSMFGGLALVDHMWNKDRIAQFLQLNILDNVLLGPSYIARKYSRSVPAVYVCKDGNEYTGTGFLTTTNTSGKKFVIVSAKHNIDSEEKIEFVGFNEIDGCTYTPISGKWILHPKLDLALIEVKCERNPPPIFPIGTPLVLSRTITLGYPSIATTDSSYMLAHGGELNAIVNTYHGEDRLIISNFVSPGNSGGPVLDEAGLCLGVVVNSFETQHQGGTEKANSAIPARHVLDFISPFCN
ncbi:serine protease [Afifella sp. IM 167]|uniref:S1 family peptidase n=1 Tax=Afifella sp. IM 167 TaxID=2033586 RepID=UPI001CCF6A3D|nr:serine protease [Afifella sp. IM 167]MBZ8133027.1 hypothetical protein [Afifella sp. IM 167]